MLFCAGCPDPVIYEGYKLVFCCIQPAWCTESECHASLHRRAALMGLCYIPKSTRAVKRLPANLYDPPPGVVLPRCLCQLAETDKACITSSLFQQQLHLRFAEFPPFSRADYTHVVLSLRKAPVLWNEVERRAYDMLDVTSADGSGRETSVWSGLSLGGDRSIYCRTADKCTWTPPKDSDQLLCHQRLYHTDRD